MKKGFTLVELLATIVILGILSTITVPTMINRIKYFKEKSYKNMIVSIENATEQYINDNRGDLEELNTFGYMNVKINTLINEGYLKGNLINPKTKISVSKENIIYVSLDDKNKVDVNYDPNQEEHPKITLKGPNIIKVKLNGNYTELGAMAFNKNGADITNQITINGTVDTTVENTYIISYSVLDSIVLKRYVIVTNDFPKDDIEIPVLSSNIIDNYIETQEGVNIIMPVVSAIDNIDGIVSPISPSYNNLNINETGTYHLKYNYTDSSGNKAQTLDITVVVKP